MSKRSKPGGSLSSREGPSISLTRCDEVRRAQKKNTHAHAHAHGDVHSAKFFSSQTTNTSCTDDGRPLTQMGAC